MYGSRDQDTAKAGTGLIPGNRTLLAMGAIVFPLCALAFVYLDKPALRFFETGTNATVTFSFQVITYFGVAAGYLVIAAMAGAGFAIAAQRARKGSSADRLWLRARQSLFFLGCVLSATITVDILKIFFGRTRPQLLFQYELYGFDPLTMESGFHSFPSGHAATASAVAFALYLLKPEPRHIYTVAALLVCVSRVVLTAHFVSDVVFGATWGFLIAALTARILEPRLRPFAGIGNKMPAEQRQ